MISINYRGVNWFVLQYLQYVGSLIMKPVLDWFDSQNLGILSIQQGQLQNELMFNVADIVKQDEV